MLYASHVTFSDEDLQLRCANHSSPLYVTGMIDDKRINQILLNYGSVINHLLLRMLRVIEITSTELSPTLVTIQGFNPLGQNALSTITLKVELHDLYKDAIFHVIAIDPSYNALLEWSWLYVSKVITSTLHQCLKYTNKHNNERAIQGDANPFHGKDAVSYTHLTLPTKRIV